MTEAFVTDGDLGSGEPGSLRWHFCNLSQRNDKEKIEYIRQAFPNMSDEDKLKVTVFLITETLNHDDDSDSNSDRGVDAPGDPRS